MGAKGAAIATVSAQGFSFLFALVYLCKKGIGYSFYKEDICFSKYIQKIMQIGFPLGLQSVLVNISFLIITIIVNQMGLIASASLGVVEKLMIFNVTSPCLRKCFSFSYCFKCRSKTIEMCKTNIKICNHDFSCLRNCCNNDL